jgi:hypothetical protein
VDTSLTVRSDSRDDVIIFESANWKQRVRRYCECHCFKLICSGSCDVEATMRYQHSAGCGLFLSGPVANPTRHADSTACRSYPQKCAFLLKCWNQTLVVPTCEARCQLSGASCMRDHVCPDLGLPYASLTNLSHTQGRALSRGRWTDVNTWCRALLKWLQHV